jgi:hypothetical protein
MKMIWHQNELMQQVLLLLTVVVEHFEKQLSQTFGLKERSVSPGLGSEEERVAARASSIRRRLGHERGDLRG